MKHTKNELAQMQSLPLNIKILLEIDKQKNFRSFQNTP